MVRLISIAALVAGISLTAPAAVAQDFTIPSVSLPNETGIWGCRFYGTCSGTAPVTVTRGDT